MVAIIDAVDAPRIMPYKWHAMPGTRQHTWYAAGWAVVNGVGRKLTMHRLILGERPGLICDHRDGDGLNNRRSNLRFATRAQNRINSKKTRGRYLKGVRPNSSGRLWQATIMHLGVRTFLGNHATERQAHEAYLSAARELHGEFLTDR